MNIAIVRTGSGPLNIDKYNIQEIGLGKALVRKGVSVDLYSRVDGLNHINLLYKLGDIQLRLIPLKGHALKQITYYPGLVQLLIKSKYDFVQVHEDSQLMTATILKSLTKVGVKTILYQGMYENYRGLGSIYQTLLDCLYRNKTIKYAHYIFAKTNAAKKYLEAKSYFNISLQPIGLDFTKEEIDYIKIDQVIEFKKKFKHLLLYVGILEPRRDVCFILKILKSILSKSKIHDIGFVIVGKGPDSDRIKKCVKNLQLEQNVLFINSVQNNQIGSIYRICDVFVLPSYYEIYGMVVMEALYNGIPVISSDTAGPSDILKENFLGITLAMNKDHWIREIKDYLSSKYMQDQYKQKRKEYIIKNYSWDILAQEYLRKINMNQVYENPSCQ